MKWGAQQAEQLLSVVFTSMKEYTMNAKMEKTLGSLNAQTEAAFAKAMLALGTQSDAVLYKLTFEGWVKAVKIVRDERQQEELAARMAKFDSDKDAGLQKLMAKFAGDQKMVMYKTHWVAWKDYVAMEKSEREEAEAAARLMAANDKKLEKMAVKFGSDQAKVLMTGTFAAWRDSAREGQALGKQRELKLRSWTIMYALAVAWSNDNVRSMLFDQWFRVVQKHREEDACTAAELRLKTLKAKTDTVLDKTLKKWGAEQGVALCGVVYQSWHEVIVEKHQVEALQNLSAAGDAVLQKAMMKWGAQQTGQLLMVTFTCWKEFLQKEKEDRALDEINQRMADLAAKGDATLQKTMMKWGAQQAEQLVSVTFQSWKEDHMKMKEEAELDALNKRMADLAAKGDSTMQKTMMKWGAQQAEQLVNVTFSCWKEDYKEEKQIKFMLQLDEGKNVQMQKLMMKFAGDQAKGLLLMTTNAWKEAMRMKKEEELAALMEKQLASMDEAKEKQMQNFMLKFAGDQKSILLQRTFAAWKEFHQMVLEEMAEEKMKSKLLAGNAAKAAKMAEMSRDKKDASMKTMMKMIGGKADMLKKATFGGWHEEMKAAKYERQQEEMRNDFMAQLNAQGDQALLKKQQMERMISNMFGRKEGQLLMQVADAWLQITIANRAMRDANSNASWLLDVQQHYVSLEIQRMRTLAIVAHWRSACRDRTHLRALEQMEEAVEQERVLLRQRCEEWAARTQQAEQETTQALADQAKSLREMEILRAKLDEETISTARMEREVADLRDQVNGQAVRCRTLQRQQAAMAVLQVGNVEERENLDRQLQQLSEDRDRMLDAKAALLKEQGDRRMVEWQLEEVLKQGANNVLESERSPSPLQRRPVVSPPAGGQRWR